MKQWIDAEGTVIVRQLADGEVHVLLRGAPFLTWGAPITVEPDRTLDEWTDLTVLRRPPCEGR